MEGLVLDVREGVKERQTETVEEAREHWGAGHNMAQVLIITENGLVLSLDRYLDVAWASQRTKTISTSSSSTPFPASILFFSTIITITHIPAQEHKTLDT